MRLMSPTLARLRPATLVGQSTFWMSTHLVWGALMGYVVQVQMVAMMGQRAAEFTGITIGIGSIAAIVVPLIVGPLSDRCQHPWGRRRPYMVVGILLNVLGLTAMYLTGKGTNVWPFIACYAFTNVANNIATASYSGVIPDLVTPEQRGEASGYMAVMSQMGTLFGFALGGFFAKPETMFLVYTALSGVLLVTLAISMVAIKEERLTNPPPAIKVRTYLSSLLEPFRHHDFLWVWFTRALVVLGFYSIQPFLLYFSRDVLRSSNPNITTMIIGATVLISASITGFLGGIIADRIGRKRVVIWSNSIMAAVCILFTLAHSVPTALIAALIFGASYGAYYSVDWALGTDVLPSMDDAGKDMAVWHIAMTLPQALAAPIAGYAIQAFGVTYIKVAEKTEPSYNHAGYVALFVLAAIYVTLGAAFLKKVRGST